MGKRRRQRERLPFNREQPPGRFLSRLPGPHAWLSAFALFLVVAGARCWLIGGYGTDVPWLDQWDAEAAGLYLPWHAGTLTLHNWFAPHNEHHIFFTRALALGLLRLNRQWDPRLQAVVNAGLYAMIFAGLFLVLRRGRTPAFQVFCWVLLAALGCSPYGATNTLLGFQSQFYFLAGFSLLAIYCLGNSRPGSLLWMGGIASGFAALVSMGSGYAAGLAALGVLLCSSIRSGKEFRQELARKWMTVLAIGGLIAAGVSLQAGIPRDTSLGAKSAADFGGFLLACLSWPGKPMILLAFVAWIPLAIFLANYLRGRTRDDSAERFILGTGFWVLLQAVALAMFRANSGEGIESRYTDILAYGLLVNAICAVWLLGSGGLRRLMPALTAVWFVVSGLGFFAASSDGLAVSASWKHDMEIRRAATAGFLAAGDRRYLDRAPPYPDTQRLAALLLDPALRPILPAGIRPPLELSPDNASPAPVFVNGLSMPDLGSVPSGVWAFPGMFSRFAVIPPSTRFEYRIAKKGAPSFLLLYLLGDPHRVASYDSNRAPHHVVPLPPGDNDRGHHAFVYCPAAECFLKGSTGPSQLAIMEPKEVGFLSIAALLATLWGPWTGAAGFVLFVAAFLVTVPRALERNSGPLHSPEQRTQPEQPAPLRESRGAGSRR